MSKKRTRPEPVPAPAHMMKKLDQLIAAERNVKRERASLESLGYRNVTEVREMTAEQVVECIQQVTLQALKTIFNDEGFEYEFPSRADSNQEYIKQLDRIVLKDKMAIRNFVNVREVKKTTITTRVMELLHNVLRDQIHVTKRELFYTDVKLFEDQKNSDAVLDDLACLLGCTRNSLNVVASDKGVVIGDLKFRDAGDLIDCARMGLGGKKISPYVDQITEIESSAKFILLVEKDAAFMRLAEDRFYREFPCIIITAKGQPDVGTRLFLRKLRETLNIPVLGLLDSDPYGLKILTVYMSGSKNMSYDSESLTTHGIHWLGVRPSDLDKYNIPEQCRLPMTDKDIKTGEELLEADFIKKNPAWVAEVKLMLKMKVKAEIQALSTFGFQYLTKTYLPEKIKNGDWL